MSTFYRKEMYNKVDAISFGQNKPRRKLRKISGGDWYRLRKIVISKL